MLSKKETATVLSIRISEEIKDKIDKLFIDLPDRSDRVRFIINDYFKLIETFPYLNANQKLVTPEDAGFPLCDFVKAIYDRNELVGFHCLLRNPPLDLPRIRIGKRTLKICTPDICWTCVEICKKSKLGINLFEHITLEQINLYKELVKEKKRFKTPEDSLIAERLKDGGLRMEHEQVKEVFNLLKHNKIAKVSRKLGISRTTIYKLMKMFPEGVS